MERLTTIRPLAAEDLDAVLRIQQQCPEIVRWSRRAYQRVFRGEYAGWVAAGEVVCGFVVLRQAAAEAEILNLAVAPDARRRGTGTRLLAAALEAARAAGARSVSLEVRASNRPAIAFYERHGFRPTGRRRKYYTDPREDALLYSCSV